MAMIASQPTAISANGQQGTHDAPFGARRGQPRSRNPLVWVLNLFSSVWLGVFLLTCLFIYSSVGSSGVPIHLNILDPASWVAVRQLRWFELTEFEWFHWWPFDLLIALICVNLVVATLRRIPFNLINLGVWMIHAGIIILCIGSVWYFSTKVEGDAPVNRRLITVELPGVEPTTMVALPGNRLIIGQGAGAYELSVVNIDPQWELLSGDEKGVRSYKVSVAVQSPSGMFIRELIANRPQYTQDLVRSEDPQQPFQRAVKALGKPLVDESLKLTLKYAPQDKFYLMDSRAVYLREIDANGQPKTPWIQRPILGHDLPRYNDYIASRDDVFASPSDSPLPLSPLDISVPAVDAHDPLPGVDLGISRYLRYAQIESRRKTSPEGPIDPVISVRLSTSPTQSQTYQLAAFDPRENSALQDTLRLVWIDSPAQIEAWKERREPVIRFRIPGQDGVIEKQITELSGQNPEQPFEPIEGTDYSFRVEALQNNLVIGDKAFNVAIVQLRTPERTFTRWVFDNPSRNSDRAMAEGLAQHEAEIPLDTNIETVYVPGKYPPAPILLIAGPGENDLNLMLTMAKDQPKLLPLTPGGSTELANGVTLDVLKYAARTEIDTRPFVVPREQRDRDMRENLSMIRVDVPAGDSAKTAWLPYHHFAFNGPEEVLRRFPYQPVVIPMPDGRRIEMMFSRASTKLPAPVALDDFVVESHIGGFTGQSSSIMDWTSQITFETADGWTKPVSVSMNKPKEFDGYWFFQAQWDPPDPPRFEGDSGSRGLNYTVLGVGNRNGVNVQLLGCCIAVLGMIYNFYVKPIIKRRRARAAYAHASAMGDAKKPRELAREPVGAAWKAQS